MQVNLNNLTVFKHTAFSVLFSKNWRIRVSIPVPRRCERRTLPIELIPHLHVYTGKMATPAGFEPARAKPNRFLIYRLNHSATVSVLCFWIVKTITPLVGLEPTIPPLGGACLSH